MLVSNISNGAGVDGFLSGNEEDTARQFGLGINVGPSTVKTSLTKIYFSNICCKRFAISPKQITINAIKKLPIPIIYPIFRVDRIENIKPKKDTQRHIKLNNINTLIGL